MAKIKYSPELGIHFCIYYDPNIKKTVAIRKATKIEAEQFLTELEQEKSSILQAKKKYWYQD